MKAILATALLLFLPASALAGTSLIDTGKLPSKQVYETAQLIPLAMTAKGAPAVVLLDVKDGDVVPPHATKSHLRLLTVLSGDMSWGDGSTVNPQKEKVYPAGSVLTIPSGADHWLAARNGPVRIQLIVLDDEAPVPGIEEQMK